MYYSDGEPFDECDNLVVLALSDDGERWGDNCVLGKQIARGREGKGRGGGERSQEQRLKIMCLSTVHLIVTTKIMNIKN